MRLLAGTFALENKRAVEATEEEQYRKIHEEYAEFVSAVEHGEVEHAREEAVDLMRTIDGWVAKQPDESMRAVLRAVHIKERLRGDTV